MPKKKTDCKNCDDLTARLDRLEKRLEIQEETSRHWKKRWGIVDDKLRKAEGEISILKVENAKLKKIIEKKDAQISSLQKKLYAASTEVSPPNPLEEETLEAAPPKRPRGMKRDEVARLRQIIAGQKFASAQRDYEPPSHCIGPHRAPGVSVAPAGAWETALAGRRFQNVPLIVRLHERSGQLPSRIVKTGNSSMAWVA